MEIGAPRAAADYSNGTLGLMAGRTDLPTLELEDQEAWADWLEANHATSAGVWLKIAKKAAKTPTVTYAEALEGSLCYGWIDGRRVAYDGDFFLQRFTPRRPKSRWSQINRDKAIKLTAESRMKPAGVAQVQAARDDGRWHAAYEPQSNFTIPEDFQAELDANPDAKAFFDALNNQNRFALCYRIKDAKRPETRARRIAQYVEMLNERRALL
jgi:uncharacterized protein YdeI (YjbR/CyaY-like superfamily)